MECTPTSKHHCEICDKSYSSRQNLWKHNTKFHKPNNQQEINNNQPKINIQDDKNQHDININQHITVKSKLVCKYCKKIFSYIQSRWRHEIKCKTESTTLVAQQNDELKKQMDEMKQQIANLLKSRKIHPKTLQKINNQNNNTNNGIINNNVIMKFGNVNINDVLSNKQIMSILHKPFISVEECIKMIHFNEKLPQYNNIYITNLKDDLAYVYDGTKFTTTTKTDTIYDMITNYTEQIELSFDDNKDKLNEYKIKCVENYLELINSNTEYIDQHNKKYTNFKTYKVGDVKRLIYDKSDPKKFAMVCKGIDV